MREQHVPFGAVTWPFAQAEGEGFTSVENWRDRHWRLWAQHGAQVREDEVACPWLHLRVRAISPASSEVIGQGTLDVAPVITFGEVVSPVPGLLAADEG
jgi:hypothetical protein